MKQRDRKLNSFKELVKKAKDVKAKMVLQPCLYIKKTNHYYLKGNWAKFEKVKSQYNLKNPKIKESKVKPQLSTPQQFDKPYNKS